MASESHSVVRVCSSLTRSRCNALCRFGRWEGMIAFIYRGTDAHTDSVMERTMTRWPGRERRRTTRASLVNARVQIDSWNSDP